MSKLKPPKNKRTFTPRCCSNCHWTETVTVHPESHYSYEDKICMRDGESLNDACHQTVCDGWRALYFSQ